jgi:hypothetical protein
MNITCFSCKSPRDKVREMVSFSDRRDLYLCNECIDLCHEITHKPEAAERAAMEQDAARYRWLRDRDLDVIHHGGVFAGMTPQNVVLNGADLDAAVDAAMQQQLIGVQP